MTIRKKHILLLLLAALLCGCGSRAAEAEENAAESAPSAIAAETREADALVISEVMSDNDHCIIRGQLCDWVELYNAGDTPVELGEYFLSKREDDRYACQLPARTLESGEYALLLCGADLSFNLSKEGTELYLTRGDGAEADALSLPALGSDESYTCDGGVTDAPSPGYANTAEGTALWRGENVSDLVINEVMTSNASAYAAGDGYYDWVELYNGGDTDIDLSGLYLSKSKKDLRRWQLPGRTLRSGEYIVLLCSGNGGDECSFRLSAEGDDLYLSDESGAVLEALAIPAVPTDRSWGRSNGELVYFANPTPGSANGKGHPTLSSTPVPSIPAGMYDGPFTLILSGEGDIYYTLDGTLPTTRSTLYAGEEIKVEKNTALRAFCVEGDHIPSGVYTYNYFIGIPDYELDVVSVTLAPLAFSGELAFDTNTSKIAANIALFEEGEEQFSVGCEISLFGSGSRSFDKKSYQISFKTAYGPAKLRYRLFDNLDIDEFDSIVLRSGAQDIYYASLRDEFFTSLLGEACENVLVQAYRPVNLYINGAYWGLYYIRERVTDDMIASHSGVSADSVTIVKGFNFAASGPDGAEWRALYEFILRNDMRDADNYRYVAERLDMDSAIDFFAAEMWSTNYDYGNIKLYRSREGDGKWRFVLYDMDVAMLMSHDATVKNLCDQYGGMLSRLLKNEEFLERFTARLAQLLKGPLREEVVLERLEAHVRLIEGDMQYNCQRWPYNLSYEKWLKELDKLRSGAGIGIQGWNKELVEQYIAVVPAAAALRGYFDGV